MPEPRDPLLKVLTILIFPLRRQPSHSVRGMSPAGADPGAEAPRRPRRAGPPKQQGTVDTGGRVDPEGPTLGNDPSAGSPTETLLRLLLPLNDRV